MTWMYLKKVESVKFPIFNRNKYVVVEKCSLTLLIKSQRLENVKFRNQCLKIIRMKNWFKIPTGFQENIIINTNCQIQRSLEYWNKIYHIKSVDVRRFHHLPLFNLFHSTNIFRYIFISIPLSKYMKSSFSRGLPLQYLTRKM